MSVYNGIDTTQAAWQVSLPKPINFTGWLRQAAGNYLCQLAGVDPATQTVYADRPTGAYNTTDSTEDLLVATTNNPLSYHAGYKLGTVFAAVQQVRGTLTLTSADPTITPDITQSTPGLTSRMSITPTTPY